MGTVAEIRFVDVEPRLMVIVQAEAHQAGLILQCNPKTGQTLMCEKLLRDFQPIRTGYKRITDCLRRSNDPLEAA